MSVGRPLRATLCFVLGDSFLATLDTRLSNSSGGLLSMRIILTFHLLITSKTADRQDYRGINISAGSRAVSFYVHKPSSWPLKFVTEVAAHFAGPLVRNVISS